MKSTIHFTYSSCAFCTAHIVKIVHSRVVTICLLHILSCSVFSCFILKPVCQCLLFCFLCLIPCRVTCVVSPDLDCSHLFFSCRSVYTVSVSFCLCRFIVCLLLGFVSCRACLSQVSTLLFLSSLVSFYNFLVLF